MVGNFFNGAVYVKQADEYFSNLFRANQSEIVTEL